MKTKLTLKCKNCKAIFKKNYPHGKKNKARIIGKHKENCKGFVIKKKRKR